MEYNEEEELKKIKESYENVGYFNGLNDTTERQEMPLEWRIAGGILIAFIIISIIQGINNYYQEQQAIKEINLIAESFNKQTKLIQETTQNTINNLRNYPLKTEYYTPKKWKHTIWDIYKGRACNNQGCLYSYERQYQDCLINTQQCYIQTRKFTSKTPMPQNKKITYL